MKRLPVGIATMIVGALILAGCAASPTPHAATSTPPSYAPAAVARLQAGVLSVATTAADGDAASALTRLDDLAALAGTARASGEITVARLQAITESIALVRADLEAAVAAKNNEHGKPGKKDSSGNSGSSGND